jgi:hypothetical protein
MWHDSGVVEGGSAIKITSFSGAERILVREGLLSSESVLETVFIAHD